MPLGLYRIKVPTIALFEEDGHRIARTVPPGACIAVNPAAFDRTNLVNVTWDGKKVMMFRQDLLSKSELVPDGQ